MVNFFDIFMTRQAYSIHSEMRFLHANQTEHLCANAMAARQARASPQWNRRQCGHL